MIRRLRRRLRAPVAAAVLLALTAAACSGGAPPGASEAEDRPVTVLGPWTGEQEDAFRALLDKSNVDYVYQGTAAQREVLLSQVQAGTPPDIALMPSPGELADYARKGQLQPLEGLYNPVEYGRPWQPHASGTDHNYWVPVKADLKSIVWHRSGTSPSTWPGDADAWCIGMGDDGASGWPGSDWIEDLLLQRFGPDLYDKWAGGAEDWTGGKIEQVWRSWGELLGRGGGNAATRALLTDHRGEAGGNGLLYGSGAPRCSLEHQGSFARTFYGVKAADAEFTPTHELLPGDHPRFEVSGDYAAMFTRTPQSKKLLRYLASADVQQRWAKQIEPPVYTFSANSEVSERTHGDPVSRKIAGLLRKKGDVTRCLDASDTMPPAVRDAFYEATLRFLSNPSDDPGPLLQDVQEVQDEEKKKLRRDRNLTDDRWMTDICNS